MQPNILLIITHDLGTHLGCYGGASVQTPALDGLAAEGARFGNHFCAAPYCSPSRGAVFTGKYPHCNGLMGLVNLGWDLPVSNVTLGQTLASAGYETFLFGLQHEVQDPARLSTYFHHVSHQSLSRSCDRVATMAVDFLNGRDRNNPRPFYARVGFSETHRPFERYVADDPESVVVPPYMADTPGARQDIGMFQGAVRCMDAAVGRIFEALAQTGQAEHTLVVFTTDHGIAFPRAKATLYDPGLRSSLILRYPDHLSGGMAISELTSHVDLFPSLLDAAGVSGSFDLQGRSFWGLLAGTGYTPVEEIFAEKNTTPEDVKRCIRTRRYKYIRNYNDGPMLQLPTDIEASLTRRDMGDGHLQLRPPTELYDLAGDPLEMENLSGRPEQQAVEQDLAARLDRFLEETEDPILRGPLSRPTEEAALIQRARSRIQRAT